MGEKVFGLLLIHQTDISFSENNLVKDLVD